MQTTPDGADERTRSGETTQEEPQPTAFPVGPPGASYAAFPPHAPARGYGAGATYPVAPAYPPPPEFYRQPPPDHEPSAPSIYPGTPRYAPPGWSPPSAPFVAGASTAPELQCRWCGAENRPGAERCVRCGASFPQTGRAGEWAPIGQRPSQSASPYPPFAPDGRVDPELMRRTEPGAHTAGDGATAAVGLGATVLAALSKVAVLIKFALPLVSALASFGLYAALYGWQFGLGIVGLLFAHEMGHFVVIRAKGLPARLPVFVPLLGAYVAMRQLPQNALDGAEIAIAGPVAGTLAGFACYGVYEQTGLRIWLVLAFFSFFLNLLNLIPVSPLDGGRIVGAISKWFWPVGLGVLVIAFLYTHSILLLIVGWLGLLQMVSRFRAGARLDTYYKLSLSARIWVAVLYFGLTAVLAVATFQTQGMIMAGGGHLFGS